MDTVVADLYEESMLTVEGVIESATREIERGELVAGAGRKMSNPMLSVFLGEGAMSHIREIQDAYFACWSDYAKKLKVLKGAFTTEQIESAVVQATRTEDNFWNATTIRIAWYWDIMDAQYEQHFACVKQKFAMPVGVRSSQVFFVFCSQSTTDSQRLTRARLEEDLIPWAKETGNRLVVLSDSTGAGLLSAKGLAENYRLAASMMLIMNSIYTLDEEDLGSELDFKLKGQTIWSASYRACSKNFYDIVGVSLYHIIDKYRQLGQKTMVERDRSVQQRLCGEDGSYYDFLDDVFQDVILEKCKVDMNLWGDVPFTQQMQELEEQMLGGGQSKGGFFSRLFGGSKRQVSTGEALASLGDFWDCCVDVFYVKPILKWLDSEEGGRDVRDYMYSRMTSVLNYDEMNQLLLRESESVANYNESLERRLPMPEYYDAESLNALLHGCACREMKLRIYKKLLRWLSEAMKDLHDNASGFDELLVRVSNSLRIDDMERSVVRAYGTHMEGLLGNHPDVIKRCIRPCRSEDELLAQLERAFVRLVDYDTKHIYQKSLQGHLKFLIENGGAADAADVISACFNYNMVNAGRLQTLMPPNGSLYCIMNKAMEGLGENVRTESVGKSFLVNRSDRIERLFVYPVEQSHIIYSNACD